METNGLRAYLRLGGAVWARGSVEERIAVIALRLRRTFGERLSFADGLPCVNGWRLVVNGVPTGHAPRSLKLRPPVTLLRKCSVIAVRRLAGQRFWG